MSTQRQVDHNAVQELANDADAHRADASELTSFVCAVCEQRQARAGARGIIGERVCATCARVHDEDVALEIVDADSGERSACSLAAFADANSEDVELVDEARALLAGASLTTGGGAAPRVLVKRLS